MFAPASGEQSNLEAHFVVVPVGSQNIRAEAHRPVLLIGVQLLAAAATAALFCEYVPQIVVVPKFGFVHTRRLALVSMKRRSGARRARHASFRDENPARSLPRCGTSRTVSSAYAIQCAALAHLRASAQSICRSEAAWLHLPSRGYRDNSS